VSNAVKYTPSGEVRVKAGALDEHCVEIEVRDTGIGIDAVDRSRVFERFFRADNPDTRAIRGTGLGLAIAKLVAEQHNGRIEVESRRGAGSSFRVLLPKKRGAAIPEPRPSSAPAPAPRARPLVLAIDDDRLAHRIIAASLQTCGIDLICAETGEQGVRIANEHRPEVMLVDLELPDFNGLEVIASVRAAAGTSPPKIIVISGQERPKSLESHGVASFLPKPVRSEVLREEVLRVLGGQDGSISGVHTKDHQGRRRTTKEDGEEK
jgi:CheY-like chemotaxis protein